MKTGFCISEYLRAFRANAVKLELMELTETESHRSFTIRIIPLHSYSRTESGSLHHRFEVRQDRRGSRDRTAETELTEETEQMEQME